MLCPTIPETQEYSEKYGIILHDLGENPFKFLSLASPSFYVLERFIFRLLNLLFEYPEIGFYFLVRKRLKKLSGFDLLISIAVPHPIHWGVASVWHKYKPAKTWVADCGDPFMGGVNDSFKKCFYFNYFENKFLRLANYVSIPFDDLKYKFNRNYSQKFVAIPQGFDFSEVELADYKKSKTLRIGYAGSVIPGHRHPAELIAYLKSKEMPFTFYFFGTNQSVFKKEYSANHDFLSFEAPMKRLDLIKKLSELDFLVNVMERNVDDVITAIPSKLIDYQLTKRPILNYTYGKLDVEVVEEFLSENYEGQFLEENFEKFNIEIVAKTFLDLAP